MRFLLTGFEPFGGSDINPSWEVVRLVDETAFTDIKIIKKEIPVCFNVVKAEITNLLDKEVPDVLISIGQSFDASVTLEKVAINWKDARIPDNCELQPHDEYIIENGPPAFFSTLPLRDIQSALQSAKIPSEISYSAGTFCCNQLMYSALHYITQFQLKIKMGFIHVPCLPQQTVKEPEMPSMALTTITKALNIIIQCIADDVTH